MYFTTLLVGSWAWAGIRLSGQAESFPPQYVQQFCCIFSLSLMASAAKDDLDREPLLCGRLVLLARVDGHAYWVSNAILSKLTDLPDVVDGGVIIRHEDGNPTGQFSPPCLFTLRPRKDEDFIRLPNRRVRRHSNGSDQQLEASSN
jgi:hypothetical protein